MLMKMNLALLMLQELLLLSSRYASSFFASLFLMISLIARLQMLPETSPKTPLGGHTTSNLSFGRRGSRQGVTQARPRLIRHLQVQLEEQGSAQASALSAKLFSFLVPHSLRCSKQRRKRSSAKSNTYSSRWPWARLAC